MSAPLRVELVRSGGFANLRVRRALDVRELPPAEAEQLRRLVDRVDLDSLNADAQGPAIADRFQYDLTVASAEETRQATFGEAPSLEVRALIEYLLDARGKRG